MADADPLADGRLSLTCESFEALADIIARASHAVPGTGKVDQVRYLASYLRRMAAAATVLVETPYVDRHWLDEYAHYYATLLHPPAAKATRLHFLRGPWSLADVKGLLHRAIAGEREQAQRDLEAAYLGFAVIRPLPSAPIGRTILRPYDGDPWRCYAAGTIHNQVHLAGLTLAFEGLPFQQQDQGVGACATTALWSALSKVKRNDGDRVPTPFAITSEATRHQVYSRALPALDGLDLGQMATAILTHGYQPHTFQPDELAPVDFALWLKAYLRSGIPVVVRVRVDGGMHALTFVGFREQPELGAAYDFEIAVKGETRLRSRGVVRWYVHDDRLGPYARLAFVTRRGVPDYQKVKLQPTEPGFEDFEAEMCIVEALVPLYPKLRLTAEELVDFAFDLHPALHKLASDGRPDAGDVQLYVEPWFALGGEYLRDLQDCELTPERLVELSTELVLSRYVGVLRWYSGTEWICDAVYDTTDLQRRLPSFPPLLALIPRNPEWIASLENT